MAWPITEGRSASAHISEPSCGKSMPSPATCHAISSQEAPEDHSAPQGQECFVNVLPLLVPHPQSPELIQPSEGPFDHPAPSPQPAAMFGVALREKRDDVSVTQGHNHGRPMSSQDDGVGVPALLARSSSVWPL